MPLLPRAMSDIQRILKESNRKEIHRIWVSTKRGETLPGQQKRLGQILLDHPQYHNFWEFADVLGDTEVTDDAGVNPFLHVALHQVVENQIGDGDLPEAEEAAARLLRKGLSRDEVVHRIANPLTKQIFRMLKFGAPFNRAQYVKELRKL